MKRSRSSTGKGPGAGKSKGGRTAKPARSFSKKPGGAGRGGSKPFRSGSRDESKPERKSYSDRSGERPDRYKTAGQKSEGPSFQRKPGRPAGRTYSSPARGDDRPERFKREGERTEGSTFKRSPGRPPGRNFSGPSRGGDRPERSKQEGDNSEVGSFKRSSERPSGRNYSGPGRGSDRPARRSDSKSGRGDFKRPFDKPASGGGGKYLRRKEEKPESFKSEERDSENIEFKKPQEENSSPAERKEKSPFRDRPTVYGSENYTDKKKRKRVGDSDKPAERKDERSSDRRSSRTGDKIASPRSYGEKRHEPKPGKEKRETGYVKRDSGDRPEKPWNRKEKHEFYGDKKKPAPTFLKTADDGTTRLNKFIANAGICSRREADELIEAGVISVNGEVVTEMGYKVMPGDNVKYNNELLRGERMVYILLNKPKDFITTTDDPEDRKTVMNLIAKACKERVYPVGRLDRNTTGVLLFTNDGDLAKKLTHPSFQVHKIYQVELDRALKTSDMELVTAGVQLEDGFVKPDDIVYTTTDKNIVGMELHSGKNRIVRRIFEHLGYEVKKLDRVVFAGLTKKDVPRGRWRFLTEMEVANLKMVTGKKMVK